MRSSIELATGIVRSWTRLYTTGLRRSVRDARRAEIDSDLWEHAQTGLPGAPRAGSVTGQILARCLLGIGADLSWRASMGVRTRAEKRGVDVRERIKSDWWLPAPLAIVAFGVVGVAAHVTAGGFTSWWSDTDPGWNPSPLGRAGSVLLVAAVFVGMPSVAIAIRREHPGWTVALLVPSILICMSPMAWGEASWWQLLSLVGIVSLVGAVVNLAHHSVRRDLEVRTAPGG